MEKKDKQKVKLTLVGFRLDVDGDKLQLYVDEKDQFYVRYKDKMSKVYYSFDIVPDDFFNQPIGKIPYIVLDGNVYSLEDFESLD